MIVDRANLAYLIEVLYSGNTDDLTDYAADRYNTLSNEQKDAIWDTLRKNVESFATSTNRDEWESEPNR
jgi:hypothetical protein